MGDLSDPTARPEDVRTVGPDWLGFLALIFFYTPVISFVLMLAFASPAEVGLRTVFGLVILALVLWTLRVATTRAIFTPNEVICRTVFGDTVVRFSEIDCLQRLDYFGWRLLVRSPRKTLFFSAPAFRPSQIREIKAFILDTAKSQGHTIEVI